MERVSIRLKQEGPVTSIRMISQFLGIPLYGVHAFFIDGLLIDTGFFHGQNKFMELCDQLDPEVVVNTHYHEDHTGNNFWIVKKFGLLPLAHPRTPSYMKNLPQWMRLYRRFTWGIPPVSEMAALDSEIQTRNYRFLVVATPGHSDDHICLYEPNEEWLFSGDLFIDKQVKYLRDDEDIYDILDSLRKVMVLRPKKMFCGFSGIIDSAGEAIRYKIEYLENMKSDVERGLQEGLPILEIQRRLLGRGDRLGFISAGDLSKRNLISAFLKPKRGKDEASNQKGSCIGSGGYGEYHCRPSGQRGNPVISS